MNSKVLQAALAFGLLTTIHLTTQACTLPVEAVINNPDPSWVHVNHTLCFDGSDSWGQGGICHWQWDFGDGSPPDGHEGRVPDCDVTDPYSYKVEYAYSNFGTYYPELWVKDCYNHEDTESFTLYVVEWNLAIGGPGYTNKVAVNNDDDNENGKMDKHSDEEFEVDNEDDLVPIVLSVNSTKTSDDVALEIMTGKSNIKIWSDQHKQGLVIPDGTNYFKRWSAGVWTKKLWVEGIAHSAVDAVRLHSYYIRIDEGGGEGCVERVPDADLYFTVLEVDMDMDGVKDDEETYGEVTEETIPGGFVGLDCRVRVELKKVQPTTFAGYVKLDVIAGGSNIEVQDQQGDPISLPAYYYTPDDLPEDVWVKGVSTSSSPRDVTLYLDYTIGGVTFADRINLTVYDVEKVCLSSSNAVASPICYEGGRSELGSPCGSQGDQPSLIIPHCNVRSASDPSVIRNFTVGAEAFLLPTLDLTDLSELLQDADKWSKVAGPQSGYLADIKRLDAKYKNPKKGGVYELLFQLPDCGSTMTKSLLHLPLAGPHAELWVHDQAIQLGLLAGVIGGMNPVDATMCYMATSACLDWDWEADQSGRSPCHVWGENETITIHGIVVSDPKFQNFMWGYYCRCFYPGAGWWVQVLLAGLVGTPDTPECWEAYKAGKEWCDGDSLETVMERRGLAMQVSGELAEKLWPSTDPYVGGREGPPFFGMSESELISYCRILLGLD